MKRLMCALMVLVLLCATLTTALAAKQMEDGVPVWTEQTVRQYALDYLEGKSMERLYGYFDLQIRRYTPNITFDSMLLDLEWLTGRFVGLGSYRSFVEPEYELKTHVLHLCMEKQDLDMYFTHKDKEDDWEVMAVEFVPAEKQHWLGADDMLVGEESSAAEPAYTETQITIGKAPYELTAILTLPADRDDKVPACVFVHDFGPLDRDATQGNTKMFADLAHAFAEMGIASIRYDKRTYAYPDAHCDTVWQEVVEDAIWAGKALVDVEQVDQARIVVVGHGLGGTLAPRILQQSEGVYDGMILIGAIAKPITEWLLANDPDTLALEKKELNALRKQIRELDKMGEEEARAITLFGKSGYYYQEFESYDLLRIMRSMDVPTYIVQGKRDIIVDEHEEGTELFFDQLRNKAANFKQLAYRGLNHLLMNDLSTPEGQTPTYEVEAHVDSYAARDLALWVLSLEQHQD